MLNSINDKWTALTGKQKQNAKGISFVVLTAAAIVFIISSVSSKSEKNIIREEKRVQEAKVRYEMPKDIAAVEDTWLMESKEEISALRKENKEKKMELKDLNNRFDDLAMKLDSFVEGDVSEIEKLYKKVQSLEKKAAQKPSNQNDGAVNSVKAQNNSFQGYGSPSSDPFSRGGGSGNNRYNDNSNTSVPEIRSISVVDFTSHGEKNTYDLSNYLPAGSYVKAVLISAVDASAGISSQGDPRQVLFRIVSKAKSALDENNEALTIDIKGCIATGAASGDLSSERAYVRLLKMTCSEGTKAIETSVEGYAADSSDGKAGIVGKVISREGDLVTKSFLAGAISGFGSGLSSKFQSGVSFNDGFSTTNNITNKQIAAQGLGEGIETSSQNVSEYLIERAEQYQPVVSVASGKEVELVFVSGVYLDGRATPTQSVGQAEETKVNKY